MSPFWFFYGYIKKSLTYAAQNVVLVYAGSALIVGSIAYGLIYFFWNEVSFNVLMNLYQSYQYQLICAVLAIVISPLVYFGINEYQKTTQTTGTNDSNSTPTNSGTSSTNSSSRGRRGVSPSSTGSNTQTN